MAKNKKYVVISNQDDLTLEWGQALAKSMAICHTCAKAYEIAVFLAGITQPDKSYRQILETVKVKGAAQLKQKSGFAEATIVLVKIY